MHVAWIALGSNLGQPADHVGQAFEALAAVSGLRLLGRSRLYRSTPVGGPPGQSDFCNAAAAVATTLSPFGLLTVLNAIEAGQGRVRIQRNGPRTLDLDIVAYDGMAFENERLTLPHPRAAERAFVLEPLADIAPALSLGDAGRVADLRAQVDATDLALWY
ncbi:2-amino-4-hydroxy-6-hydroxymethyldihydropteridine diphosphokinase [Salinisphaera sp. USBA-960]|nr:2-amino-4-hydroxy-6-hydroxymethyldihydropteridine diphosphokinase [Salifodinibacter halophilus]NNC25977.1 2-amino-4-hydroxy-6-hydroxymethyldihydropteridine diphosphokinase [Salifodinibacter halophilus]